MERPSPRKFVKADDDAPVYASRCLDQPKALGKVVFSDFGSTVRGDEKRNNDAQPDVYRPPEVMLKVDWSYPVDIWDVGAMVWDLIEDKHLFYRNDPDGKGYSTHAHLAEVMGILGPPPSYLIKRGVQSHEFFTEDNHWKAEVEIPQNTSSEKSEEYLDGENKEMFLRL